MRAPSPPLARRRVARWLRAMRLDAGLSLEQAAPRLDLTTSSLHRLETGVTQAHVHVARSMMDLYDRRMPELLDVIRASRRRGWWQGYQVADRDYLGWEAGAARVYEAAVLRVPDLLQTEEYTRHLMRELNVRAPAGRLGDEIHARRIRQSRLTDTEDPLDYSVVLDESALRNRVGDSDVMRHQLARIVECASWPTVHLLVLPASAGAHVRYGGFRLLDFDHPDDPPVLYADVVDSGVREDRPELVADARQLFEIIASSSLSREDAKEFVQRIARELYSSGCGVRERKQREAWATAWDSCPRSLRLLNS